MPTGFQKTTDLPDTDDVVGVSSEESLTVSRPGQRQALGRVSAGSSRHLKKYQVEHFSTDINIASEMTLPHAFQLL